MYGLGPDEGDELDAIHEAFDEADAYEAAEEAEAHEYDGMCVCVCACIYMYRGGE